MVGGELAQSVTECLDRVVAGNCAIGVDTEPVEVTAYGAEASVGLFARRERKTPAPWRAVALGVLL